MLLIQKGEKMKRIFLLFVLLALASLACQSQAVDPAPAPAVVKLVQSTNPTPEKVMTICLTAESVRLRMGAGTSYGEVAILKSLDSVTVTGVPIVSEDMGVWMPVRFGGLAGFVNARYLCG